MDQAHDGRGALTGTHWKNAKHVTQWTNTLEAYAYPQIGRFDVRMIDTGLVRKCLDPIWTTKTETASRQRQRVETVLDWAKVHVNRTGDNPAAWRGHLQALMPTPAEDHQGREPCRPAIRPYASVHDRPGQAARHDRDCA